MIKRSLVSLALISILIIPCFAGKRKKGRTKSQFRDRQDIEYIIENGYYLHEISGNEPRGERTKRVRVKKNPPRKVSLDSIKN